MRSTVLAFACAKLQPLSPISAELVPMLKMRLATHFCRKAGGHETCRDVITHSSSLVPHGFRGLHLKHFCRSEAQNQPVLFFLVQSLHCCSGMAPKKTPSGESHATLVIQSAMKNLVADEHRDAVNFCHSHLQASKELAMRVQYLIKSGALEEEKDPDRDFLIPSSNKWHLLKGEIIQSILTSMARARDCSAADLQKMKTITKKTELLRLLCFLLNTDPQSAIYSKHIPTLKERCCQRFATLPARSLTTILEHTQNGCVRWEQCGVFRT